MGMRLSYENYKANNKSNLPGPGAYEVPERGMIDRFSSLFLQAKLEKDKKR